MQFGLCASDPARMRGAREWGCGDADTGSRAPAVVEPYATWPARRRPIEETWAVTTHLAGFSPAEARFVGSDVDCGRLRGYLESCVGRAAEIGVRTFNW